MTDRTRSKPAAAAKTAAAMDAAEADVAEQHRDLVDEEENGISGAEAPAPYDADPADAAEQRLEVGFDDDEYR